MEALYFPNGLGADTYTATDEFRSIPAHECVCRPDGGLIATTGPAGDPTSKSVAALFAASPDLLNVAKAMLLLHSASQWTNEKAAEWERLIHPLLGDEPFSATTKALCDAARAAIAKTEAQP